MENKNTCNGCERETEDSGYCLDCYSGDRFAEGIEKSGDKKRTKYDLIRNMSMDELIDVLYYSMDKICFDNCTKNTGNKYNCLFCEEASPDNCKECIKQWLESECESNANTTDSAQGV